MKKTRLLVGTLIAVLSLSACQKETKDSEPISNDSSVSEIESESYSEESNNEESESFQESESKPSESEQGSEEESESIQESESELESESEQESESSESQTSEDEEEEKTLTLTAKNFNKFSFITLNNVVENTQYPEEFTMNKNDSSLSSNLIHGITAIEMYVYGNYENHVVYNKVSGGSAITKASSESSTKYNKATHYVYNFSSDEFKIENKSSYNVYLYEVTFYYTGELDTDIVIEEDGIIDINKSSYNKHSKLTSDGITVDNNKMVFSPNGYVRSDELGIVTKVEMIEGTTDFIVYAINDGEEQIVSWELDETSQHFQCTFPEGFTGFIIANEKTTSLSAKQFIVTYKEPQPVFKEDITIEEALEIGGALNRNRGITAEKYVLEGTIIEVNGSQAKLRDETGTITLYASPLPDGIQVDFYVKLKGQIQNYYGTVELVNFEIVELISDISYEITLAPATNGTYYVSKTKDIKFKEEITITVYPDDGYKVDKARFNGVAIRITDNVGKIKVTSNGTITVTFKEISDDPVTPGSGFTIHSLEMKGTYGDANLIKYGNYDVLVDGGTIDDGTNLRNLLNEYVEDGVVDLLIISHPDSDHYYGITQGGALEDLDDVTRVILNNHHNETNNIENYVKNNFPSVVVDRASDLTSETNKTYTIEVDNEFSIDIMYSSGYLGSGKNNASIPAIFNYRNTRLFMGGDMEQGACTSFLNMYPDMFDDDEYIIFKGLHHGSNGSNKDDFLDYLKPDFAFVNAPMKTSTNKAPSFSTHPYLDAMVRIGRRTTETYWSGLNGNLTITCDGYKATVEGAGRTVDYSYYNYLDGSYTLVDRASEANTPYFKSKWYKVAIENSGAPDLCGICS